jgi:hypothetical protein
MGIGEHTLSALLAFRPQMKQITVGSSVKWMISSFFSWLDRTHKCPLCFSGQPQEYRFGSLIGRDPLFQHPSPI